MGEGSYSNLNWVMSVTGQGGRGGGAGGGGQLTFRSV